MKTNTTIVIFILVIVMGVQSNKEFNCPGCCAIAFEGDEIICGCPEICKCQSKTFCECPSDCGCVGNECVGKK
ncbi:hypothetical protein BpHYR1_048598 [Brachionus plicatilis]|uniref:Uncharacterized protein n=1 Tax=Brachionus plicatilis TaxID=10195 RepID=A0A3M7STY1_BRAPC|nr:hypothetical protein BpHYR1_048598 [Brachionus plicatilis]